MKKILPVVLVLFAALYLNPIYPVFAQQNTSALQRLKARQQLAATNSTLLSDFREKAASRAAELKQKLANFRDQRKATLAEKINTNLTKINQNRVDHFNKVLDVMSGILDKVSEKASKDASASAATSDAQKAIEDAKTAIQQARANVTTQSERDYTIQVNSETTVRADAKAARDKLVKDLKDTTQTVVDAKKAVAKAIMTVAKTKSGGVENGQ